MSDKLQFVDELEKRLAESTGHPSRDNDKLKRIGHKENDVGSNFYRGNCDVFPDRHRVCARVREVAIGACDES